MKSRALLALCTTLSLMTVTSLAQARCAPISLPREIRVSVYIVEATLEGASETELTFRVDAQWKGTPPAQVTIPARMGRSVFASASDVGQTYLLFLGQSDDGSLHVRRCGSSRGLAQSGATLEELRRRGLTRRPR